jgi:hypothetical protein
MSQVISIRVPDNYEEACVAFKKEIDLADSNGLNETEKRRFMVSYDNSAHEIQCEGDFPDSVFSALVMVKDQFGGKLFYEGVEWKENESEVVEGVGPHNKIWIILGIIFFPITLVYLFIRVVVWVPFKIWKATR